MRPGGTVRTTLRGGGRPRPAVSHRRRRPLRLLFLSPFPVEETLPRFPCTALRWRPAEGSPSSPVVTSWATSPPCPQTLLRDQQPSLRLRLVLFGSLPVFCGFHAGGKSDGVCVSRVCVPPPPHWPCSAESLSLSARTAAFRLFWRPSGVCRVHAARRPSPAGGPGVASTSPRGE